MKPEKIKKWLEGEEIALYDRVSKSLSENEVHLAEIKIKSTYALDVALLKDAIAILKDHITALERLAACRELSEQRRVMLKKHQYRSFAKERICRGCGRYKTEGCSPDCLWAQAIEGE